MKNTAGFYSSKNRYELLKNKFQQTLKRWCWFCDEETEQGMWEDGRPNEPLKGGFGDFFCQCKSCGSFVAWMGYTEAQRNELPIPPKYAIKINRWDALHEQRYA